MCTQKPGHGVYARAFAAAILSQVGWLGSELDVVLVAAVVDQQEVRLVLVRLLPREVLPVGEVLLRRVRVDHVQAPALEVGQRRGVLGDGDVQHVLGGSHGEGGQLGLVLGGLLEVGQSSGEPLATGLAVAGIHVHPEGLGEALVPLDHREQRAFLAGADDRRELLDLEGLCVDAFLEPLVRLLRRPPVRNDQVGLEGGDLRGVDLAPLLADDRDARDSGLGQAGLQLEVLGQEDAHRLDAVGQQAGRLGGAGDDPLRLVVQRDGVAVAGDVGPRGVLAGARGGLLSVVAAGGERHGDEQERGEKQ